MHTNSIVYNNLIKLLKTNYYELGNINDSIVISRIIAKFAYTHYTGCLSSTLCEEILNEISSKLDNKKIEINIPDIGDNKKNILHVFTHVFDIGGHTKLASNWMKNSFSNESHHILLLNQNKNEVPFFLKEALEIKNGHILTFKEFNSDTEKAIALRKIANNFDYIVFHIHMNDPILNLAFGHDKSKYNSIFMNHSDHLFWLGSSASNHYAELAESGQQLSYIKRNINTSSILPIPLEEKNHIPTKKEARKKLSISDDTILLLSIAMPHKFIPDKNVNFYEMSKKLISSINNKKVQMIIIGPNKENIPEWKNLFEETDGQVNAIGFLREGIELYHSSCDIYLDCFPYGSYTATLEPALIGRECVLLDYGFKKTVDSLIEANFLESSIDNYVNKIIELINFKYYNDKSEIIRKHHVKDGWKSYLSKMYIRIQKNEFLEEKNIEKLKEVEDRFDKFSFDNLKDVDSYYFIQDVKKDIRKLNILNKIKVLKILSFYYPSFKKIKSYIFLLKNLLR